MRKSFEWVNATWSSVGTTVWHSNLPWNAACEPDTGRSNKGRQQKRERKRNCIKVHFPSMHFQSASSKPVNFYSNSFKDAKCGKTKDHGHTSYQRMKCTVMPSSALNGNRRDRGWERVAKFFDVQWLFHSWEDQPMKFERWQMKNPWALVQKGTEGRTDSVRTSKHCYKRLAFILESLPKHWKAESTYFINQNVVSVTALLTKLAPSMAG